MVKEKRKTNKETSKVTNKIYQVPPISGAAYEYATLVLDMVHDHVRYELEKALSDAKIALKNMMDAEKEPDEVELRFDPKGNVTGVLLSKDKVAKAPDEIIFNWEDYWDNWRRKSK